MRKQSTYSRTAEYTGKRVTANQVQQLRRHAQATTRSTYWKHIGSTTEIIPVGMFRLSADSGYMGQAERVTIHRNHEGLRIAESNAMVSTVDSAASMTATREYTAIQRDTLMRHQQADVSPPLKIPWWVWLFVVCGIAYLVWRLWRKRT